MDPSFNALIIMQMRYKVPRNQALEMGETWLQENSGQTWDTLTKFLKSSQVVVVENQIVTRADVTS